MVFFESAIGHHPPETRAFLIQLRELILDTAAGDPEIGPLEETLKWGEPAFLTSKTGSGTTIRINAHGGDPRNCALYVHCQTDLIARWSELYGDRLDFEGNRAIILRADTPLPESELRHCIAMALTYHSAKKRA